MAIATKRTPRRKATTPKPQSVGSEFELTPPPGAEAAYAEYDIPEAVDTIDTIPRAYPEIVVVPDVFSLTNLFGISLQKSPERQLLEEEHLKGVSYVGNYSYTGPQLSTFHRDVFVALIRLSSDTSVTEPKEHGAAEILKEMGLSDGKINRNRIKAALNDLSMGHLKIRDTRVLYKLLAAHDLQESMSDGMKAHFKQNARLIELLRKHLNSAESTKHQDQDTGLFLTAGFIRNLLSGPSTEGRYSFELDPYTVLLYKTSHIYTHVHTERVGYRDPFTSRIISIIHSQQGDFYPYTEEMWQSLLLPNSEQMTNDRADRNRRMRFRKNFKTALENAELFGEILPGWSVVERQLEKEPGQRGRGLKTFITKDVRRPHAALRRQMHAHSIRPGSTSAVLLCQLDYRSRFLQSRDSHIELSISLMTERMQEAMVPEDGAPSRDASTQDWLEWITTCLRFFEQAQIVSEGGWIIDDSTIIVKRKALTYLSTES